MVFSFMPRSHEQYGWQKYQVIPNLLENDLWLANSPPLSEVIDFSGNNVFVNNSVNAFSVVAASLFGSLIMMVYKVAISTMVNKNDSWSFPKTVSIS